MKKILSVLLVLAMALTAVAYAETAAINPVETVLTDEEKLTRMLPVLDAVIDTMGIEGEVPYTADDASLVWNVLIAVATNERETNPLILSDDALMIVPKSVMLEYAAASFFGMTELPEIPADPATVDMSKQVAYDEVTETYRIESLGPEDEGGRLVVDLAEDDVPAGLRADLREPVAAAG